MSSSAISVETEPRPRQDDEAPYYSVDIVDRDGRSSWPCRAHSVDEALDKAHRAHSDRRDQVKGAEFDKFHLGNRIAGSETKIYRGVPLVAGETRVDVRLSNDSICNDLNPRLDLANHSPTGLSWGYAGSGPAQLSLALLADALDDDERALKLYQPFKRAYVAGLPPGEEWWISASSIQAIARFIERQMEKGLAA